VYHLPFSERDSNPSGCEIKADLSLEIPGNIGPPFNFTFQIQNLGFFPVRDLQLNIEIPEMTKNGNQLLQISDFHIDKVRGLENLSKDLDWSASFERPSSVYLNCLSSNGDVILSP
uniref:Integrin alpha third immunoglobulin-like domain-containing protein n=1 Tax=Hucho hucho TaxID=62062 RepID=A0A4W5NFI9_9TELE